jgi:hypothetical protein
MPFTTHTLHRGINRAIIYCGWTVAISALAALCLRAISMPLSFDEFLHAHYLWLIDIGKVPHRDFWCHYSASGFAIVRPLFRLFPESIYTVFALRLFGIGFFIGIAAAAAGHAHRLGANRLWGVLALALAVTPAVAPFIANFRVDAYAALAAIIALTIMFRQPAPLRSGAATGLAVLSVIIMPKYVYPLLFGLIAHLAYGYAKKTCDRRALTLGALAGGTISLGIAQGLLLTSGVRLWDDLYWSPMMMQRFLFHCLTTDPSLPSQLTTVAAHFTIYWWASVVTLAGLSGWVIVEAKRRDVKLWVGIAMLAGVVVFWATCGQPWKQFLVPGLLCLALFAPYAEGHLKRPWLKSAGTAALVILAALMVYLNTLRTAAELSSGAAIHDFNLRQQLLSTIPRSDKVVGFFKTHPCFREDETFVTWDEQWGRPKGFLPILPAGSQARSSFQPDYLRQSLEQSTPPAIISFNDRNYPAGWNEVLSDYLAAHQELYEKTEILDCEMFLRKDLAR